ncbi:MAG: hypothetical protein GF350_06480, partial [Chitinivibrionales bacterium]|nr:hypothetical protein [Chitinivibrionales bacterium]
MNYRKKNLFVTLAILCYFSIALSQPMAIYYVSPNGSDNNNGTSEQPFKTIEKAKETVRTIRANMTADIEVILLPGRYDLTSTLRFDENDGGTNNHKIIYKAQTPNTVSISGGKPITGWQSIGNNVYKASWASLGFDPKGFRQLYVKGKRCIRARHPNLTQRDEHDYYLGNGNTDYLRLTRWDKVSRIIEVPSSNIQNWTNLKQIEMIVQMQWERNWMRIDTFATLGDIALIAIKPEERDVVFYRPWPRRENNQPFHFENSPDFIDMKGEWCTDINAKEVYYMPRDGEDLSTDIAIAPYLDTLIKIEPQADSIYDESRFENPVKNIEFYGIIFEYAGFMRPSYKGHIAVQAEDYTWLATPDGQYVWYHMMLGNIYLNSAEYCKFEECVFRHLGGTGLALHYGCHYNEVIGNIFYDISGNGIAEGETHDSIIEGDQTWQPGSPVKLTNEKRLTQYNTISNNYITKIGQEYTGALAVQSGYTKGVTISHNEVFDIPYSGLAFGWGWDVWVTPCRENVVRANKIHKVMTFMEDGGGIYTLSRNPGSFIDSNCIYNMHKYNSSYTMFFNIYCDEGSSLISVKDNRIYDTDNSLSVKLNQPGPGLDIGVNGLDIPEYICEYAGIQPEYQHIKNNHQWFLANDNGQPPTPVIFPIN